MVAPTTSTADGSPFPYSATEISRDSLNRSPVTQDPITNPPILKGSSDGSSKDNPSIDAVGERVVESYPSSDTPFY